MPSSPPRYLVVGATGQVGSKLLQVLGKENVIAASRTGASDSLQLDLAALSEDTSAAQAIFAENKIAGVFCVGGATDVERCETDPLWADRTNHLGPAALAALSAHLPFAYFSTEYVFNGKSGPYTETDPIHPICEYGRSKARGEEAILRAHPGALILRTTVVYGDDPGAKNFLYSLRRILSDGERMRVPADQISTPTFNWDLANASVQLLQQGHSGIFHVCGPDVISRYDFAVRGARIMGLDAALIQPLPTSELKQRAPRPLNAGLLSHKLHAALPGFTMRGADEGIRAWLSDSR